jgi:hypothetical protein
LLDATWLVVFAASCGAFMVDTGHIATVKRFQGYLHAWMKAPQSCLMFRRLCRRQDSLFVTMLTDNAAQRMTA